MSLPLIRRPFFARLSGATKKSRHITGAKLLFCLPVLLALLAGCAQSKMPPITAQPSQNHHQGKIVWHDLLTPDVEAAQKFYGALFGWSFKQQEGHILAYQGGKAIAGIIPMQANQKNPKSANWALYLSVTDVDGAAALVQDAGGKVLKGPAQMEGRGRYAVIQDPQNAHLVLLKSGSGDPADEVPAMNSWLWNELWSSDAPKSVAFYKKLANYSVEPVINEQGDGYWLLLKKGKWRAGIATHPFLKLPSQWVPIIRIADLWKIAALVKRNGGRVILDPGHQLCGGNMALVEDPTGAIFMVETWQPNPGGKEGQS
jgi:predicted enzyme related to lactoylglutathione lyase